MPVQDPGAAGAQREGRGSVRVRVEGAPADSGPRREAKGLPVQQEQRQGEKQRYNSKEFLKKSMVQDILSARQDIFPFPRVGFARWREFRYIVELVRNCSAYHFDEVSKTTFLV